MIEIRNIEKRFRHIQALKNVSLVVNPGRVTGVVGPNGCGKTTLIKAILGLVIPDRGTINVCGQLVDSKGAHRELVGYLPQTPDFPNNLRIAELFSMVEDIRGRKAPRLQELVEMFELEKSLNRNLGVISGGMRQKVATTLAFMFDPPVLILDEPSVGLDPVAAVRLKALIEAETKRDKTILLVSHVMSEAEQLLSEMAFLLDGHLTFAGEVAALQRQAGAGSLEEALLYLMAPESQQRGDDARH